MVSVSDFLATLFQQLFSLALVSLTIRVTCFLLLIEMQKRLGISTRSIFQSNLRIVVRSSLSYPLVGIHRTLLLKSSNMPLLGKTVPVDVRVVQRGLLFLFVHWFNEGCCVEGGEIGEEVRSVGKVTREMRL
jgi:hypothetical protein